MEEIRQNDYCIILAGGMGRRLWPVSTESLPKQFIDFFGTGRTLLQQTYDRFAAFIPPSRILVSTYEGYVSLVKEQLPGLPAANILPEPVQLNTAPAAVWCNWHAILADPDANLVVTPADQLVQNAARFEEQVRHALRFVDSHEVFLALGAPPTMANTAYGYIQMGRPLDESAGLYEVKSFSEKPQQGYARAFLESGEFLWNTGIFLWSARTMASMLAGLAGRPYHDAEAVARQMVTIEEEVDYVRSCFPGELPRSIDLLILDRCPNVAVKECDFGWADIGCWTALHESCRHDADGNAVSGGGRVMFSGTSRSMVSLPEGMDAVICGLDNYLVAEKDGRLLICPNTDPDLIRRLINEARFKE